MSPDFNGRAVSAELTAVITRADGRVERLGVIAYWHRNPLKRWAYRLRRWLKKGK